MPLYAYDQLDMQAQVAATTPSWAGVSVRSCARYLGFVIGPGKQDTSWDEPLKKYLCRAKAWGQLEWGYILVLGRTRLMFSQYSPLFYNLKTCLRTFMLANRPPAKLCSLGHVAGWCQTSSDTCGPLASRQSSRTCRLYQWQRNHGFVELRP